MLDWQPIRIAAVITCLLLISGCITTHDKTPSASVPPASCDSNCAKNYPNAIGNLTNGSCACQCKQGYVWYSGSCMASEKYDELRPAICDSSCKEKYSHSKGLIKAGNCTCPCEKHYVYYNQSCILSSELNSLSAQLCPNDHPVLKLYSWSYKKIDSYIYLCYADSPVYLDTNRSSRQDYWNFVNDPRSDPSVSLVTELLSNISKSENLSKNEQVEFAIAFVQSLPYTFDNVSTPFDEYPRFPSETIYADGGDCEDTSILMAAILKKMGYDIVLLELPRHMATGVLCNPSDFNYSVASYSYGGRDYCYLETTGENFRIGELPQDFSASTEVKVIPIPSALQPDMYIASGYKFASSASDAHYTYVDVTGIHLDNFGTAPAGDVKIYTALEAEGKVWSEYTYSVGNMPAGNHYDYNVTNLRVPTGERFQVLITVSGSNFTPVTSRSSWAVWR
jgi:hypothetical protein